MLAPYRRPSTRQQGIKIRDRIVKDSGWDTVTLPIIHDSSTNGLPSPHRQPRFAPRDDNRTIIYTDGIRIQAYLEVRLGGYSPADTKPLIRYYSDSCGVSGSPAVGLVDMAKYSQWTKKFGVPFAFRQPTQVHICQ